VATFIPTFCIILKRIPVDHGVCQMIYEANRCKAKLTFVVVLRAAILSVVLLWFCLPGPMQLGLGALRGPVKDTSGAIISGAQVQVTEVASGPAVRQVSSGSDGNDKIPDLGRGTYVTLEIGANFRSFTLNGAAPLIDTENGTIGRTIISREIRNSHVCV